MRARLAIIALQLRYICKVTKRARDGHWIGELPPERQTLLEQRESQVQFAAITSMDCDGIEGDGDAALVIACAGNPEALFDQLLRRRVITLFAGQNPSSKEHSRAQLCDFVRTLKPEQLRQASPALGEVLPRLPEPKQSRA